MTGFIYSEWADSVSLQDTAIWSSIYTGEVLFRIGDQHHDFMSFSNDQRKRGPCVSEMMRAAVISHTAIHGVSA